MKKRILGTLLAPIVALGFSACTVEQTEEGELPDVEGGQLPEYDVDPIDVDIDWDTMTVRVPDIDINRDTIRPDTSGPRR